MFNQHHLLWQRSWYDTGYCRSLRNLPYTKVMLDKKLHKALHEEISEVPIPTGTTAKRIVMLSWMVLLWRQFILMISLLIGLRS